MKILNVIVFLLLMFSGCSSSEEVQTPNTSPSDLSAPYVEKIQATFKLDETYCARANSAIIEPLGNGFRFIGDEVVQYCPSEKFFTANCHMVAKTNIPKSWNKVDLSVYHSYSGINEDSKGSYIHTKALIRIIGKDKTLDTGFPDPLNFQTTHISFDKEDLRSTTGFDLHMEFIVGISCVGDNNGNWLWEVYKVQLERND